MLGSSNKPYDRMKQETSHHLDSKEPREKQAIAWTIKGTLRSYKEEKYTSIALEGTNDHSRGEKSTYARI